MARLLASRRKRSRWERELRGLDSKRDAERIVFIDASLEFPWDTQRSLELAFYRTYAVPSIATLLDSTGEFTERAQKRYDDTQILISAFYEFGNDSDLGRRAIRRMNQVHGGFEIANDGLPHPSPALRRSVEAGLRARSRLVGLLPPRRKPRLRTLERHRSYPQGYQIEELGPSRDPALS